MHTAAGGRRLVSGGDKFAENERIKMTVNHDGTFEVSDKATGVTYHRVAALEDVGDVGDEYNYSPPASDRQGDQCGRARDRRLAAGRRSTARGITRRARAAAAACRECRSEGALARNGQRTGDDRRDARRRIAARGVLDLGRQSRPAITASVCSSRPALRRSIALAPTPRST